MSTIASIRQASHRLLMNAPKFEPGDKVLSTYARPWRGTVLQVIDCPDRQYGDYRLLEVRQEIDGCGRPIIKGLRKKVRYNVCHFQPVP